MAKRSRRRSRGMGVLRYISIVCACVVLVVGAVCLYGIQLQNRQADQVTNQVRADFYAAKNTVAEQDGEVADGQNSVSTQQPIEAPKDADVITMAPTVQVEVTAVPTEVPTDEPTEAPTAIPTEEPTAVPTEVPTAVPTAVPTEAPTAEPTATPTVEPTVVPTEEPTAVPTEAPTDVPALTSDETVLAEEQVAGVSIDEESVPEENASETGNETVEPVVEVTETPVPVLQPAFEELYNKNNDLIGWLEMAESIKEPVLYRDIDFYMNHDFDGKKSQAGAIFLDPKDGMYMTEDDMLILYGHNMKNGAMFGDLDFFRKEKYLQKYPIIYLQSAYEETPRAYAIFAFFDASMNKDNSAYFRVRKANFETAEEKQEYIDNVFKRALIDIPLDVNADDQLLQLVTCSYSHDNGRFLMFARELRADETIEGVTELYQ